ncbi:MAG: hypothetical protein PHP86_15015 [Nevskiales bacterium]|nr:hypothetical protein [Nevskiales bacterium]
MAIRYGAKRPAQGAGQLLSRCSDPEIEDAAAAASALTKSMQRLAESGRSVLTAVTQGELSVRQWQHWPQDDAHDRATGYRYYYHCHPGQGRSRSEHGHFHLFADAGEADDAVTHLAGIGVDAHGLPLRLFTTNRWVTDEQWRSAPQVLQLLERFQMRRPRQFSAVHHWLQALLRMFGPQLRWLLRARDQRIRELRAGRPRPGLFDDRRVTILSQIDVSLAEQAAVLDRLSSRPSVT